MATAVRTGCDCRRAPGGRAAASHSHLHPTPTHTLHRARARGGAAPPRPPASPNREHDTPRRLRRPLASRRPAAPCATRRIPSRRASRSHHLDLAAPHCLIGGLAPSRECLPLVLAHVAAIASRLLGGRALGSLFSWICGLGLALACGKLRGFNLVLHRRAVTAGSRRRAPGRRAAPLRHARAPNLRNSGPYTCPSQPG